MHTVRWTDIDCIESAGEFTYRDMTLAVGSHQIARWKDDPDGRFALSVSASPDGRKKAALVKFYPSL